MLIPCVLYVTFLVSAQITQRMLPNCWQDATLVLNAIRGTATVSFRPTLVVQCDALPVGVVANLNISSYNSTLVTDVPDFSYRNTTSIVFTCPSSDIANCQRALRIVTTASMSVESLGLLSTVKIIQSKGIISQYYSCFSPFLSSVTFTTLGPAGTQATVILETANVCTAVSVSNILGLDLQVDLSSEQRYQFGNVASINGSYTAYTFTGPPGCEVDILLDTFPTISFNEELMISGAALISTSTISLARGQNYSHCFLSVDGYVSGIGVTADTVYNSSATLGDCVQFLNAHYAISFIYAELNGGTQESLTMNQSSFVISDSPTFSHFCADTACFTKLSVLMNATTNNFEGRLRIVMYDVNDNVKAVALLPMNVTVTCWMLIQATVYSDQICITMPLSAQNGCGISTVPVETNATLVIKGMNASFAQSVAYWYNRTSLCFPCATLTAATACPDLLTSIYAEGPPIRLILTQSGVMYPQYVFNILNSNYWPSWYLAIALLGAITLAGLCHALVLIMRVRAEVKKFKKAVKKHQHEERKRQRALRQRQDEEKQQKELEEKG